MLDIKAIIRIVDVVELQVDDAGIDDDKEGDEQLQQQQAFAEFDALRCQAEGPFQSHCGLERRDKKGGVEAGDDTHRNGQCKRGCHDAGMGLQRDVVVNEFSGGRHLGEQLAHGQSHDACHHRGNHAFGYQNRSEGAP